MYRRLEGMVGMGDVVEQVERLHDSALVQLDRKEKGMRVSDRAMHMVFAGPSGTGKSTVADEIAKMYHALGLIPSAKRRTVTAADFIAAYEGQTEDKTRTLLKEAKGGVLFVDEAYGLYTDDPKGFGARAVTEIVDFAGKNPDTVIILAGYPGDLKKLMQMNEGLTSRFPTTVNFKPYSDDDAAEIAARSFKADGYTLSDQAAARLKTAVKASGHEGNARNVMNLRDKILLEQAARLAPKLTSGEISEREHQRVSAADVQHGLDLYLRTAGIVEPSKPRKRRARVDS